MQPLMSGNSVRINDASVLCTSPITSPLSVQMNDLQRYIDNPSILEIDLPLILEKEGNLDQVVVILEKVMEKSDPNEQVNVAQCIYDVFMAFPTDFQSKLLENQPLFFVQLIEYWSVEQRQKVLKHLTKELTDWKKLLVEVFQNLDFREPETKPSDKLPGRFLTHLIENFSSRRKRQWIKYCSREMFYDNWAFFVIVLKAEDRKLALRGVSQTLNYDFSENVFFNCFEAFSKLMDQHPVEVKTILEKLLDGFYRAKSFRVIINQFKILNFKTQVCVLHATVRSKLSCLLLHYRNDVSMIAQLFNQLFLLQKEFEGQKELIERFAQVLNGDNLSEFVQYLQTNDSKAGGYLLICLSDETFQNFIYDVDVNLRTEILLKSDFNSTAEQLLNFANAQRNSFIYESMHLISKDVAIEYYTVNHFFDSLKDAVEEMLVNYTSSIISIPPVIIGLVTKMGNHSPLMIRLAPFMNDEQLKFFVSALSEAQFYTFVEKHSLSLGFGKQETLLKGLSTEKLIRYLERKTGDLKNAQKKFYEEYHQLHLGLDGIEEGQVLHSKDVEKLEDQAVKLHALARMPLQSNYHYLSRFLRNLNQNNPLSNLQAVIDELQTSMDQLKSKSHFFQRPQGLIVNQLDALKSSMIVDKEEGDQTIDLTRTLYDGFWTVVRDGTLPYLGISPHSQLGITDVNQLSCLGILSNADLEHLGISSELQKKGTNIILELEKFKVLKPGEDSEEQKLTFLDLWNEYTQIKLSDEEVYSKCQQMIDALNPSLMIPSHFKKGVVNFCNELVKFPHLSKMDKSNIRRKCTNFSKSRGEKIISQGHNLLMKGLLLLRTQHPLFCLQRYLVDNVNLKKNWEILRLNGFNSIKDLFEKQLIGTYRDLLQLEEVTKKMDVQPMEIV